MFEENCRTRTGTCILDFLGVIFKFMAVLGKFILALLNPGCAHLKVLEKYLLFITLHISEQSTCCAALFQ